jgi:hypothetical protein
MILLGQNGLLDVAIGDKLAMVERKRAIKEKKWLHGAINSSLQYIRGTTTSELCKKKSTP